MSAPSNCWVGVLITVQMGTEQILFLGRSSHKPTRASLGEVNLSQIVCDLSHFESVVVLRAAVGTLSDDEVKTREKIRSKSYSDRVKCIRLVSCVREIKLKEVCKLGVTRFDAKPFSVVQRIHDPDEGSAACDVSSPSGVCFAAAVLAEHAAKLNDARRACAVARRMTA